MKIFRRTSFSTLIAGICCMFLAIIVRQTDYNLWYNLQPISVWSMLGSLIWSVIFLKAEPTLTRIGLTLIVLTVFVVFACSL